MKLTKLIYIGSPYTGKSPSKIKNFFIELLRYRRITKITGILQDKYPFAFIGPITQSHVTSKHMNKACGLFSSWEQRDLTYISRSDEMWVVMLPGWKDSVGVNAEIQFSINNNIKVKYLDPNTLRFIHNPYKKSYRD
jgi:hypothetical protein